MSLKYMNIHLYLSYALIYHAFCLIKLENTEGAQTDGQCRDIANFGTKKDDKDKPIKKHYTENYKDEQQKQKPVGEPMCSRRVMSSCFL
jgi:hypothetical protein